MTDAIFAALLAIAATLVAFGAAAFHEGAGFIVGGVMLAGWSWLVLGGDGSPGDATP